MCSTACLTSCLPALRYCCLLSTCLHTAFYQVMRHLKKYPTVAEVVEPCIEAYIALGKGRMQAEVLLSGSLPVLIQVW